MSNVLTNVGGIGFLIGICSGGSNPVITMGILIVSAVMVLAAGKEDMYE